MGVVARHFASCGSRSVHLPHPLSPSFHHAGGKGVPLSPPEKLRVYTIPWSGIVGCAILRVAADGLHLDIDLAERKTHDNQ